MVEKGEIKGNKSSYYKKTEKKTVTTTSKYVNLGVNSLFDVGDIVYVLGDKEYDDLTSSNIDVLMNEIEQLKEENRTLKDSNNVLSDKLTASDNEIITLNATITMQEKKLSKYNDVDIDQLNQSIMELNNKNGRLHDEKDNLQNEKDKLNKEIHDKDDEIKHMGEVQADYRVLIQYLNDYINQQHNRHIFQRIINTIVELDRPALQQIDFNGDIKESVTIPATIKEDKPHHDKSN